MIGFLRSVSDKMVGMVVPKVTADAAGVGTTACRYMYQRCLGCGAWFNEVVYFYDCGGSIERVGMGCHTCAD
ncbi:hypothetical protein [Streptomyces echinatus]|uniref:hypothetical protein n=1 Tax=Streptomyces echinatus TaxID=67293 RepID=UPI0038182DCD